MSCPIGGLDCLPEVTVCLGRGLERGQFIIISADVVFFSKFLTRFGAYLKGFYLGHEFERISQCQDLFFAHLKIEQILK